MCVALDFFVVVAAKIWGVIGEESYSLWIVIQKLSLYDFYV